MRVQNPFETKAGNNSVVDALIGNAYEVVKYVAYYVKEIRYVALNMADVHRVSQGMYENVLLIATIEALDTVVEIDLPEGVTALMLINSSVNVVTPTGDIYGDHSGSFTWFITGGKLQVTIPDDAPGAFVGSSIRWLLNWQSPIQVG